MPGFALNRPTTSVSSKVLIYEGFKPFDPGERVVISFRPDECYVFPYPDTGLLKEIEAI